MNPEQIVNHVLLFLVLGLEYINHTYIRKIGERSRMTR